MAKWFSPTLGRILLTLALLTGLYVCQLFYDGWKMAYAKRPNVPENVLIEPHPLPAPALKKVALGMDNLVSDIVWLQTIQYYGGGVPYEKYRRLPDLLNIVTDIDKRFAYPYTFGLLVMPNEGYVKESVELGNKGLNNPQLKKEWEIPYYLGLTYHFKLKDYLKAAKLFEQAAKYPGAPEITRLMAAHYYADADQRETAYNLFAVVYQTSDNEYVRNRAKQYLDHWQMVFDLEKAAKVFKERNSRYPNSLQEMVDKGILKVIPPDPLGLELTINPQTGIVSEIEK